MRWNSKSTNKDVAVQMTELTQALREVSEKLHEKSVQVTVESLHVDQATLENLIFRLDSLDIRELSGSLNLGNNFGQVPQGQGKSTKQVRLDSGAQLGNRVERLAHHAEGTKDNKKDNKKDNTVEESPKTVRWANSVFDPTRQYEKHAVKGPHGKEEKVSADGQLVQTTSGYVVRF